ncbi:MAG: glycerophosphodiester phosphodiesterase family protein [Flavobacteriales bacterium]|nr:glycerophosphodiester phosphodiesterase family protein [Flavobacteriales bacterium]MCB9198508.1 glycerophosphodiester phosphodiesterase family protein [Flavobacteriales bacterium]
MKTIWPLILILILGSCDLFKPSQARLIEKNYLNEKGSVMIVAHRANLIDSLPENSLEGVLACIEHKIDIIEIDLQITKDNVLIVMHDDKLDRMTNGKGYVKDKTWEEIQTLYLRRSNFGPVTTYKVPSFEQVLSVCKGKIMINVDKAFWYLDKVTAITDSMGMSRQIILKSYDPKEQVDRSLGEYPTAYFMPIFQERNDENIVNSKAFLSPENENLPQSAELIFDKMEDSIASDIFIESLISKGIRPMVNSLSDGLCGGHSDVKDPEKNWQFLINTGFSIIQTDKGLELRAYLDSCGSL